MGLLDREKLLEKEELQIERVDLDKGDFVFVRQMTGRERDIFEASITAREFDDENVDGDVRPDYRLALEDFRAKLAVCTVCDEEGNLLLNPDDYEMLSMHMSAARLECIINKAQALNKISEKDKKALVKNSEGVQSDASTSDSVES